MKQFGLIGERLGHSHSKTLHALLADYAYDLWPMPAEALGGWVKRLRDGAFDGMNVTIPYKKAVMPYLDEVGETARRIGCVNTVVRREGGVLYGDNTDAYGMSVMARRAGIDFSGRKTLVLGSGGTSLTACDVVRRSGGEAIVISRSGENNYANLDRHRDADYLINTTPVGMYPHWDEQPVDLLLFPRLRGVMDVIYNPLRTRLLLQAERLGIPCEGGLSMLIHQAVRACELFTGAPVPADRVRGAERALRRSVTNLVLVGMPGCGKSTVGALLSHRLGMPLHDLDAEIEAAAGCTIPQIFEREGETGFRARETEQLRSFAGVGGNVLVTGGGAVKSAENRLLLRMNGIVFHITRDLNLLPMSGRPLSQSRAHLAELWREREPLYADCADIRIPNDTSPEACADAIKEAFDEALCD